MTKKITAVMVVCNEDRFIWYAINSVLDYVDKFLIYDTGSTDKTVSIIKSINNNKIIFEQKGATDVNRLVALRQEQADRTKTDWMWLVDGDEVYPKKTVLEILKRIDKKDGKLGIIVHRYDLLGDIYHFQDEMVGSYNQFGKKGHYVLRLIYKKKIPDLKVLGQYPDEYYTRASGENIKESGSQYFSFIENRIFHAMYLPRSTRGANLMNVLNRKKYKIEKGYPIPDEDMPEVCFINRPKFVPDMTKKRSLLYEVLALIITPIKQLKRKLLA